MPNVPASSGRVVNSGTPSSRTPSPVAHLQHPRCRNGGRAAGPGNVSPMDELDPRVRAVCDLNVAEAREYGGRHEYDGMPQDLSPGRGDGRARQAGRRRGKAGAAQPDPHDEAHLRAFEDYAGGLRRPGAAPAQPDVPPRRARPGLLRQGLRARCRTGRGPRRAPGGLARGDRRGDRRRSTRCPRRSPHRCSAASGDWPRAFRRTRTPERGRRRSPRTARLVAHVERAALDRARRTPRSGPRRSTALLGTAEATDVDLGALAARADAERDRLTRPARPSRRARSTRSGRPWTWPASW